MDMATVNSLLTAEEYAQLPDLEGHHELIRGEIVYMNMPSFRHGKICAKIARLIGYHVDMHDLGHVLSNDSGVITQRGPDTVRGADVAFYSYQAVPKGENPRMYAPKPPELVFEVKSPDDRWSQVHEKIAEYLAVGVRVVCVADPKTETVAIHHSERPVQSLAGDDELSLPDVLGNFRVPISKFFE
jgi:Uma2 family endonuclease